MFALGCSASDPANETSIHESRDEDTSGGVQAAPLPAVAKGRSARSELDLASMAGLAGSAAPAAAPVPTSTSTPPIVIDVDPAQEAAELEEQNARIENPLDETTLYEALLIETLQNASTVVVLEHGPIEWTRTEDDSGAWVRAMVPAITTDLGGLGCAPPQGTDATDLIVSVPFSFELPPLQPDEENVLLIIGSVSDGVLAAELVLPWDGDTVEFSSPGRTVDFNTTDLESVCEDKLQ